MTGPEILWHIPGAKKNPQKNFPLIPILMLYRHKTLQYGIRQKDVFVCHGAQCLCKISGGCPRRLRLFTEARR